MPGISLYILAIALGTSMLAAVHKLAETVPLGQIVFWRSAVALIPIVIYLRLRGQFPRGLRSNRPLAHVLRSLFGALSMVFSFLSLALLPVANALALAHLAPLIALPLAAFKLKEHISALVVLAVTLGFGGVILMLYATLQSPEANWRQLLGIAAGLGYALTMGVVRVHVKDMTATETPAAIAFYFALVCSLLGALSYIWGWVPLTMQTTLLLTATGLLGGLALIATAEAMARTKISTLAPFDYTGMIWALGFDVLLFQHRPNALALAGVGVIVFAGLLAFRADVRPSTGSR